MKLLDKILVIFFFSFGYVCRSKVKANDRSSSNLAPIPRGQGVLQNKAAIHRSSNKTPALPPSSNHQVGSINSLAPSHGTVDKPHQDSEGYTEDGLQSDLAPKKKIGVHKERHSCDQRLHEDIQTIQTTICSIQNKCRLLKPNQTVWDQAVSTPESAKSELKPSDGVDCVNTTDLIEAFMIMLTTLADFVYDLSQVVSGHRFTTNTSCLDSVLDCISLLETKHTLKDLSEMPQEALCLKAAEYKDTLHRIDRMVDARLGEESIE